MTNKKRRKKRWSRRKCGRSTCKTKTKKCVRQAARRCSASRSNRSTFGLWIRWTSGAPWPTNSTRWSWCGCSTRPKPSSCTRSTKSSTPWSGSWTRTWRKSVWSTSWWACSLRRKPNTETSAWNTPYSSGSRSSTVPSLWTAARSPSARL